MNCMISIKEQMNFFFHENEIPQSAIEICAFEKPFNWSDTVNVIFELESKINRFDFSSTIKTRIINIVIECLENVRKHASNHDCTVLSNFTCRYLNGKLYVLTGNYVRKDVVQYLSEKIDSINSLDKKEINNLYKYQLKNGEFSDDGNAGLGLIGIARKSIDKLKYKFDYIDENSALFLFLVTIEIPV